MGTRQTRSQRQIERAHERYAGVLLVVGLPRKHQTHYPHGKPTKENPERFEFVWFDHEWQDAIRDFYIAAHQGTPAPTDKTVKKFVRGFVSWCRREVDERSLSS